MVNSFLGVLSKHDKLLCDARPGHKPCRFFKSSFMIQLLNFGHEDETKHGTYEYDRVKRFSRQAPGMPSLRLFCCALWRIASLLVLISLIYNDFRSRSSGFPGKDIFALRKLFFPVFLASRPEEPGHWAGAVADMEAKEIRWVDSMGRRWLKDGGQGYLDHILHYLKDEYLSKEKR